MRGTIRSPKGGSCGITASFDVGSPLADGFHEYWVCWEPDRIRWYTDQTLYHAVTSAGLHGSRWVFDHDYYLYYLLINVAVGGRLSRPPAGQQPFPRPCWLTTSAYTCRKSSRKTQMN